MCKLRSFKSQNSAWNYADEQWQRDKTKPVDMPYKCEMCDKWHLEPYQKPYRDEDLVVVV